MVDLTAAPPAARFVAHVQDASLAAMGAAFGCKLPAGLNRAEGSASGRAALKLGPDEWLLLAVGDAPDALHAVCEPHAGSLVDVSDRQVGLTFTGARVETTLNAFVPLDLSLDVFPVGMATRTIFEKAQIVLWRTAADRFHIEVWRSFAPYVESLLRLVIAEESA